MLAKNIESRKSSSSFLKENDIIHQKAKMSGKLQLPSVTCVSMGMHVVVGLCKTTSFDLTHKRNLRIFFCQHDLDFLPRIHLGTL